MEWLLFACLSLTLMPQAVVRCPHLSAYTNRPSQRIK